MKEIIKQLLKRGDFVQSVAEEMGQALARKQMEDSWFSEDWNKEFFETLKETVNKRVMEEVNLYMKQYNVKGLIDTTVRAYIVQNISDILERKNDKDTY